MVPEQKHTFNFSLCETFIKEHFQTLRGILIWEITANFPKHSQTSNTQLIKHLYAYRCTINWKLGRQRMSPRDVQCPRVVYSFDVSGRRRFQFGAEISLSSFERFQHWPWRRQTYLLITARLVANRVREEWLSIPLLTPECILPVNSFHSTGKTCLKDTYSLLSHLLLAWLIQAYVLLHEYCFALLTHRAMLENKMRPLFLLKPCGHNCAVVAQAGKLFST